MVQAMDEETQWRLNPIHTELCLSHDTQRIWGHGSGADADPPMQFFKNFLSENLRTVLALSATIAGEAEWHTLPIGTRTMPQIHCRQYVLSPCICNSLDLKIQRRRKPWKAY